MPPIATQTTAAGDALSAPVVILLMIVSLGMAANFIMFCLTLWRRHTVKPTGDRSRDRIATITIKRAMRIEFIFFICQLARFTHTFYEIHGAGPSIYREDMLAVFERGFVTLMLAVASAWDLYDRGLLVKELDSFDPLAS